MCLESKNEEELLFPEINCLGYVTVNTTFFFFFFFSNQTQNKVEVKIFGIVTLK